jgi:hypothetical protein
MVAALALSGSVGQRRRSRAVMGYSVAIVVDRHFSERLLELAERVHVWVCASPGNRAVAETYWKAASGFSLERGVTTFDVAEADSPEKMLIGVLATVDLHHGEYSHTPPWDSLEVYGSHATSAVREALAELGVSEVVDTQDGFRCSRPVESAA